MNALQYQGPSDAEDREVMPQGLLPSQEVAWLKAQEQKAAKAKADEARERDLEDYRQRKAEAEEAEIAATSHADLVRLVRSLIGALQGARVLPWSWPKEASPARSGMDEYGRTLSTTRLIDQMKPGAVLVADSRLAPGNVNDGGR